MISQFSFIIKVILLSTFLSFVIKYGGKLLPLQPTNILLILMVFFPSIFLGFILFIRNLKLSGNS